MFVCFFAGIEISQVYTQSYISFVFEELVHFKWPLVHATSLFVGIADVLHIKNEILVCEVA